MRARADELRARRRHVEEQQLAPTRERVEQLQAFTGLPQEACVAALRRYGGNVERAATALLQAGAAPAPAED